MASASSQSARLSTKTRNSETADRAVCQKVKRCLSSALMNTLHLILAFFPFPSLCAKQVCHFGIKKSSGDITAQMKRCSSTCAIVGYITWGSIWGQSRNKSSNHIGEKFKNGTWKGPRPGLSLNYFYGARVRKTPLSFRRLVSIFSFDFQQKGKKNIFPNFNSWFEYLFCIH